MAVENQTRIHEVADRGQHAGIEGLGRVELAGRWERCHAGGEMVIEGFKRGGADYG